MRGKCGSHVIVRDPAASRKRRHLGDEAERITEPKILRSTHDLHTIGGMAKHSTDILTWARRGAEARWSELQAETAALLKAFPDLASVSKTARRTAAASARGLADIVEPKRKRRKRSKMSAAQKRAVSVRMKKYWAARRNSAKKR